MANYSGDFSRELTRSSTYLQNVIRRTPYDNVRSAAQAELTRRSAATQAASKAAAARVAQQKSVRERATNNDKRFGAGTSGKARKSRLARGRSKTMLTGSLGVTDKASTSKKTLLGQ